MYYYIFEQPKNGSMMSAQKKVKELLDFYGVAGEISRVSPARSVEELTEIAIAKQYNTIVAVGSDEIINKVISQTKGKDCVIGIIPINTSSTINKIIDIEANDFKEACLALKERRVRNIDLSYIAPGKYFLTSANISNPNQAMGTIYFDKCNAQLRFTNIDILNSTLTNDVDHKIHVIIENSEDTASGLSQTINWLFGKKTTKKAQTFFKLKHFVIDTPEPMPVLINGKIIAKTPVEVRIKPKALKIITKRAKIIQNKK